MNFRKVFAGTAMMLGLGACQKNMIKQDSFSGTYEIVTSTKDSVDETLDLFNAFGLKPK
ncbi:MAG: hypothetical protein PHS92_00250 [Candidatus Gracilibacteria bacterium]|nr:hypothetical protein [Candidatus Gracilibacteria bacterium]